MIFDYTTVNMGAILKIVDGLMGSVICDRATRVGSGRSRQLGGGGSCGSSCRIEGTNRVVQWGEHMQVDSEMADLTREQGNLNWGLLD